MRINAVLDEDLLKKIDEAAKEQKKSRSLFIREASERYLREYEERRREEERKRKFAAAAKLQDELRKKAGRWDAVREIQKQREKRR